MVLYLLGFLLNLFSPGQPTEADLRSLRWGMHSQEVRTLERLAPIRVTDTTQIYRQRWFYNYPATLHLDFIDDRLAGARYILTEKHIRAIDHWKDYHDIVKILSDRYGTPPGDYWTWNVPLYKDRPERFGDAVLLGHLRRSSVWETGRSIITLEMSGTPRDGIYTVLSYTSKGRPTE
ncbi:hypothetical protein [Larkinella soli]|uniref:hypothetical protein n=1 Tax=Larkinella soli TaxID=1770527 RepID=UPI000FFCBA4B|nr:hypothetical protein [Larkinella soli]